MEKAYLILEDGTVYTGQGFGSAADTVSEIVFNTSMTGYVEVLTDPSYAGQAVVMTWPLIGNYGVCREDMESRQIWPDGFIVRELSRIPSNFRSQMSLQEFLCESEIAGIEGIDTRALTRRLREKGTMNGLITRREIGPEEMPQALEQIRAYRTGKVVERTTCDQSYTLEGGGAHVALLDLGAKDNIARSLNELGCQVTVWPAGTSAEDILASHPDGIMLSNGPGDPKDCAYQIEQIRRLYESDTPIFAICLGHQLLALATGADTYRLRYGHRGGNHPVRDLQTGRVYITSQNHGYAVDAASLDPAVARPAFENVNDGTNEGLIYTDKNIFTVQFHPEAHPGPQDCAYLFRRFLDMMGTHTSGEVEHA